MTNVVKTPQQYCADIAIFLTECPHAWTQGYLARDQFARPCDTVSYQAEKWCIFGLIQKFVKDVRLANRCAALVSRVITPLASAIPHSPAAYNDLSSRTVAEIIQVFRCASYMPDLPAEASHPSEKFAAASAADAWVVLNQKAVAALKASIDQGLANTAWFAGPAEKAIEAPNWQAILLKGAEDSPPVPTVQEPVAA
jgi:hypothetical protein